jgi:hypothetical protein
MGPIFKDELSPIAAGGLQVDAFGPVPGAPAAPGTVPPGPSKPPDASTLGYRIPPSPDAETAREQLGLLYVHDPAAADPLSVLPQDEWTMPPDLASLPAHRNRPADVDPAQAGYHEAMGYAWKQSGSLQAPPGGASMRLEGADIVPSTRRPPERIAATTQAGAFQELQQGDPLNQFARWTDAVAENGINPMTGDPARPMSDGELRAAVNLPPTASMEEVQRAYMQAQLRQNPQGQLRDAARDDIKQGYDFVPYLTDEARLGSEYPDVRPEDASAMELQRVVTGTATAPGLGPSDEGAIGEAWYRAQYAPDAVSQVTMPKLDPADPTRRADLVDTPVPFTPPAAPTGEVGPFVPYSQIVEVKSGEAGLSADEQGQLDDYLDVVGASRATVEGGASGGPDPTVFSAGGAPVRAMDLKLVNTDPRAAAENAAVVAPHVIAGDMEYETFNAAGQRGTWSEGSTLGMNLVVGEDQRVSLDLDDPFVQATPDEVEEEIKQFTS